MKKSRNIFLLNNSKGFLELTINCFLLFSLTGRLNYFIPNDLIYKTNTTKKKILPRIYSCDCVIIYSCDCVINNFLFTFHMIKNLKYY